MRDLRLQDTLSPHIIDLLEKNDIQYSLSEQDGRYIAELEFRSAYDGDQVENIWFDKDEPDLSFIDSLRSCADDWDVDEYVEMWLEAKQHRPSVCHLNARELVEDGEWVKDFLENLVSQLKS